MVLHHSHDEEYIPCIQTQFPLLKIVIIASCLSAMVSFRESEKNLQKLPWIM